MVVACYCGTVYQADSATTACPKCLEIATLPTAREQASEFADLMAQLCEIQNLPEAKHGARSD